MSGYLRREFAEECNFFRIKCWNAQAEAAGDHLSRGLRVAVEGSFRQDTYEKDGDERRGFCVCAVLTLRPEIIPSLGGHGSRGLGMSVCPAPACKKGPLLPSRPLPVHCSPRYVTRAAGPVELTCGSPFPRHPSCRR
jgi:hypothetical protein